MKGVFVTGTDTGVGKTRVALELMAAASTRFARVVGFKPIASGARQTAQGLRNDDALALWSASTVEVDYAEVNPYVFEAAIAPHLAAARAGVSIELTHIADVYDTIARRADYVVVEGAGGWLVPLSASTDMADVAATLHLPVVLVVAMRLGCLNHALLSVEAIAQRRQRFAGWIANCIEPDMPLLQHNIDTLKARIDAPLLGVLPHTASADNAELPRALTLP
ncbi:MAG: hypothetical protein AMJ69_01510 [Gammaproteobacteria bacterium SG8_47]|nr:MAG: hypothetical protein AMJ69_01510 [Gammaproteobacteria bacterium SG8_47]